MIIAKRRAYHTYTGVSRFDTDSGFKNVVGDIIKLMQGRMRYGFDG